MGIDYRLYFCIGYKIKPVYLPCLYNCYTLYTVHVVHGEDSAQEVLRKNIINKYMYNYMFEHPLQPISIISAYWHDSLNMNRPIKNITQVHDT